MRICEAVIALVTLIFETPLIFIGFVRCALKLNGYLYVLNSTIIANYALFLPIFFEFQFNFERLLNL